MLYASRLLLASIVAYLTYTGVYASLSLAMPSGGLPWYSSWFGAREAGLIAGLAAGLYGYWRPWSSGPLMAAVLSTASYYAVSRSYSGIILHGSLFAIAIFSSFASEALWFERYGWAGLRVSCGRKCWASSLASQAGLYLGVLGFSYYFYVLVDAVYSYLLSPRGYGLYYELWSLSSTSIVLRSLLFLAVAIAAYTASTRILMPLLYAATASREELLRVYEEYLEREAERVSTHRAWYHQVLAQSTGFAVAFPAAIVAYAASSLASSLLEAVAGGASSLLSAGLSIGVGAAAYYASKSLALSSIAGRISWRLLLYGSLASLAVLAALYFLLSSGATPLGSFRGGALESYLNRLAGRVEETVAKSVESSESLLELVAKILWG